MEMGPYPEVLSIGLEKSAQNCEVFICFNISFEYQRLRNKKINIGITQSCFFMHKHLLGPEEVV